MHLKYHQAIQLLNSLQSNAQMPIRDILKNEPSFHVMQMQKFLAKLSLDTAVDQLPVIHIAGTKGKGSTSAFCESIMRHHGLSTGLYTSPHLKTVRERIRLNGQVISEALFTESFFHVWHKLELVVFPLSDTIDSRHPSYFEFLTLMAFHVFAAQKIDIAVIEVGVGGLHDTTNVLRQPLATIVTSLGMDHMQRLGHSIEDIAYNKAGIMKTGVPCYTMESQPPSALQVLREYAVKMNSPLSVCDKSILQRYAIDHHTRLGICGNIQYENASLAIHACQRAFEHRFPSICMRHVKAALEKTIWPARTQRLRLSEQLTCYFDGAHTVESVRVCIDWFAHEMRSDSATSNDRALVFYCSADRDLEALLRPIFEYHCRAPFLRIFFTANQCKEPNMENWKSTEPEGQATLFQEKCAQTWRSFCSDADCGAEADVKVVRYLDDVVEQLSHSKARTSALVTGSLHLIGNLFHLLNVPVL